jgi:hypothetical protein
LGQATGVNGIVGFKKIARGGAVVEPRFAFLRVQSGQTSGFNGIEGLEKIHANATAKSFAFGQYTPLGMYEKWGLQRYGSRG